MSTPTDARTPNAERRTPTNDAPAWVRADRACLHAWAHDKAWRKAARAALPPVHRAPGNGGTVGDQLLVQARRDHRRQATGAHAQAKEDRRHAERCICPTCKKARHEYMPTAQQQRADREHLLVAGDDWRLSDEPRAVHMSTVDVVFESAGLSATHAGKMNWCQLRERFVNHLDQQCHHALLSLAEAEPRQARIVICCALLRMRQADVARTEGLDQQRVSEHLRAGLAFMRGVVVADEGASLALLREGGRRPAAVVCLSTPSVRRSGAEDDCTRAKKMDESGKSC